MIGESYETSNDKRIMVCKQNGWKSKICQVYDKEFLDNAAELKKCLAKKAEPAVENRCDELRAGIKGSEDKRDQVCKMDGWKSI